MLTNSQVFTIDSAANFYRGTALTATAIRRLVRSGEIPSKKVGAKFLITAAAIEHWLNSDVCQKPSSGNIRQVEV